MVTRNIQTREGYEWWDRLCKLPRYGFLLAPSGNRVVKTEGIGNWIDMHAAQEIVDDAQSEINILKEQLKLAADQFAWLQKVSTLHRQVDILYVVDGYEVTVSWDDNPISEAFHGETVAEAISKAMAGFDLDACHPYQDRDIYGHERQMAALAAQRDELLAALEGLLEADDRPHAGGSEVAIRAEAAIAKAKGGAA